MELLNSKEEMSSYKPFFVSLLQKYGGTSTSRRKIILYAISTLTLYASLIIKRLLGLIGSFFYYSCKHGGNTMSRESCVVKVKVLSVLPIQQFDGEAILAHHDPRFVITVLLEGSKSVYEDKSSKVSFTIYSVAFFAIHSASKLFMESGDIVGNVYDLKIESEIIGGSRRYWLSLA